MNDAVGTNRHGEAHIEFSFSKALGAGATYVSRSGRADICRYSLVHASPESKDKFRFIGTIQHELLDAVVGRVDYVDVMLRRAERIVVNCYRSNAVELSFSSADTAFPTASSRGTNLEFFFMMFLVDVPAEGHFEMAFGVEDSDAIVTICYVEAAGFRIDR